MILQMEKLSAFGLLSDKESILVDLMKSGSVQVRPMETTDGYDELAAITRSEPADLFSLEQKIGRYSSALSSMSFYKAKKGMFAQKPRVSYDLLEDAEMLEKAQSLCSRIEELNAQLSDLRSAKSKALFLKASLEPWSGSNLDLRLDGTKSVAIGYLLLPAKTDMEELDGRREAEAPATHIEIVSQDKEQKYIITFSHREEEDALWEILKTYGAARTSFGEIEGTASENIAEIVGRIGKADKEIAAVEETMREVGSDLYPLEYGIDVASVRLQRGRVSAEMRATQKSFCFAGWVPETKKQDAVAVLDKYGCYYEFEACTREDEPPVLLKNPKLAEPFESITQMYSLPSYHGLDPGKAIAPFFFVFFGMMLSDAGYGLVLILGGWFLLKKMDLGANAKKLIKVIMLGGVSTVFWGALYGSWFGDIIPVVASVFFGKEIAIPMLLDPLQDPMTILVLSLALGVLHLFVGMGLKGYMLIRQGLYLDALYDVGFFFIAILGIPLLLLGGAAGTVGMVMAVGGCVGMAATSGRDSKSIAGRIASGLFNLYQTVTGTFSDILSYSRILALGLATGVIGSVVNLMGSLTGTGIVGAVVLLLVFVFGHLLNLAINALGSYVHTSRLQYVEFFSKFYESGGKPFAPFQANTKYITILNGEEM